MTESESEGFAGLTLSDAKRAQLTSDAITTPSPIQVQSIPSIIEGKPTIIYSPTGTGKTLAYVLPLLERLESDDKARVLILAPSAELGMQVFRVVEGYNDKKIPLATDLSSTSRRGSDSSVKKGSRIVIATPGRAAELYQKKKLKGFNHLVIDEPDLVLSGKSSDYLSEVFSRPDPKVQHILAAATLGPPAKKWVNRYLSDAELPTIDPQPTQTLIKHCILPVSAKEGRDVRLARFIEKNRGKQVIVFANQDHTIRHLFRYLGEHDLFPVSLSQERNKAQRQGAVRDFSAKKARVLLATDQAARGLDIKGIEWVVHYDLPPSAPAYLHRAGRTGRAGQSGTSVVMVEKTQLGALKGLGKTLEIEFKSL